MEFRLRDYELDESRLLLKTEPCYHHPLSTRADTDRGGKACKDNAAVGEQGPAKVLDLNQVVDDPLHASFSDPLGASVQPAQSEGISESRLRRQRETTGDELETAAARDWDSKKAAILQRFASTGSIAVTSSLEVVTKPGRGRLSATQRLERLEHPEQERHEATSLLSQQEVVLRLRQLNEDLGQAWVASERLTALRLAIKVSRLLLDTSVPHFYPTLFVLVTDCLDTVGGLVWTRIKRKAEGEDGTPNQRKLPADFTCRDVPLDAQETCRNWFYKVGAIPELLPRLYLEMALLRCYHFLEAGPPVAALARLAAMMRGLTDPLASAYAHLYLARRTAAMAPQEKGPLLSGLQDLLLLYRRVLAGHHDPALHRSGLSKEVYLPLLDPPLELTVQTLLQDAPPPLLVELVDRLATLPPAAPPGSVAVPPVASVVLHLVAHLPAPFLAARALPLTRVIAATADASAKQALLFSTMGRKLTQSPPPQDQHVGILNETWKVVARYTDLGDYLAVADVMLDFVLAYFGFPELEVLLRDIARHLRPAPPPASALPPLEHLIDKLLTTVPDLPRLLSLPQFGSLLDAFPGALRLPVSRRLLEAATARGAPLSEPACLGVLLGVARGLHDGLGPAPPDAERRRTARLLTRLIHQVSFGAAGEQHLRFLGDCRATFCNLPVQEAVVHAALRLAVAALAGGGRPPSRRRRDFVRACLAFCEVTLPAVDPPLARLHLLLAAAEVALQAGLVAHAEAAVRAAIQGLPEVHSGAPGGGADAAAALLPFVSKLASFLVVLPGHPEAGPLSLLHRLLTALEAHPGLPPGRAECALLPALASLAQPRLPYHVAPVASNDGLYCGEAAYRRDLTALAATLTTTALAALQAHPTTPPGGRRDQEAEEQVGTFALQVCNVLLLIYQPDKDLARQCSAIISIARKVLPNKNRHLVTTEHLIEYRGLTPSSRI